MTRSPNYYISRHERRQESARATAKKLFPKNPTIKKEMGLVSFVAKGKDDKLYLFTPSTKGMRGKHFVAAAVRKTNQDFKAWLGKK